MCFDHLIWGCKCFPLGFYTGSMTFSFLLDWDTMMVAPANLRDGTTQTLFGNTAVVVNGKLGHCFCRSAIVQAGARVCRATLMGFESFRCWPNEVRMEGSDGELREFHLHGPSGGWANSFGEMWFLGAALC